MSCNGSKRCSRPLLSSCLGWRSKRRLPRSHQTASMYPLRSGPHSYKHHHMRQLARVQRTPNPVCIAHALESAHASTTACARAHPRTRFSRHILARLDEHQASPPWKPSRDRPMAHCSTWAAPTHGRADAQHTVCAQVDWQSTLKMKVELGGSGAPRPSYTWPFGAHTHTHAHTHAQTHAHAHAHTPSTGKHTMRTHKHARIPYCVQSLVRTHLTGLAAHHPPFVSSPRRRSAANRGLTLCRLVGFLQRRKAA